MIIYYYMIDFSTSGHFGACCDSYLYLIERLANLLLESNATLC